MKIKDPESFDITSLETGYSGKKLNKAKGKELLADNIVRLEELQNRFYADGRRSLLIILQGLDASGKDSTIDKVFSGINPQGCEVSSFKKPTQEELKHDFLWRCMKRLPTQGMWGIFNRSYYEEVLTVKVHPEQLHEENLPPEVDKNTIWKDRYEDINNFERYLSRNGFIIIKFFLNVSRKAQAKRFLERAGMASKNWKVGGFDMQDHDLRPEYNKAINAMIRNTSTKHAPWHVIPADDKWFLQLSVIETIIAELGNYSLEYPKPTEEQMKAILEVQTRFQKEEEVLKVKTEKVIGVGALKPSPVPVLKRKKKL